MISEICAEIRNYFVLSGDVLVGDYKIEDGSIVPSCPFLDGQYYRIVGSVFNDGVHKYGEDVLIDEPEFHGAVWLMRVPQDFIQLVDDISAWQAKNGGIDSAAMSPFNSESFGGYSYTKGTRASAGGGRNLVHIDSLPEEFQNMITAQQMQYAADVIAVNGAMCSLPSIVWVRQEATDKDAFDELAADLIQMELSEMGFIQEVFATKSGTDFMRTVPFEYPEYGYHFNCMFDIYWYYDDDSKPMAIYYRLHVALITLLT